MKYPITVFTSTYNRAHTLPVLYQSLLMQTRKTFEWLIVDDGSVDNTYDLVCSFIQEGKLNINYLKTKNGGKHRAINKGVNIASGELFFIVDSDDYLTKDAVEILLSNWEIIENKEEFCGLSGLKGVSENELVGTTINENYLDCSILDYRYKYRIKGDKAEVFITNLLKCNSFPEIEGENFISESIVWNKVGEKLKIRWLNKIIYICNYLDEGLSSKSFELRKSNINGTLITYLSQIYLKIPYKDKVRSALNYYRFMFHSFNFEKNRLIKGYPILNIIGITFGYLIYVYEAIMLSKKNKNGIKNG